MRTLAFPRISTSMQPSPDDQRQFDDMSSPRVSSAPWHTRDSSSNSTSSTPLTPTFSPRGHSRWPSSSSSLATPDSPVTGGKATLEDLVEESAEREEDVDEAEVFSDLGDEPLCLCDSAFCEHQQQRSRASGVTPSAFPEWTHGDDAAYSFEPPLKRAIKRSSSEISSSIFSSRRSRRAHSILSRLHSRRPTLSLSNQTVRSAPSTPASRSRQPSASQSLASSLEPRQTVIYPNSHLHDSPTGFSYAQSLSDPQDCAPLSRAGSIEDPIDRDGLSSTPLLPRVLSDRLISAHDTQQSPLQSPSVASYSETASLANVSLCSPTVPNLPTPPLSTKASVASLGVYHQPHNNVRSGEPDIWSLRLGHANFEIEPKPYIPQTCTRETCQRLLQDWEEARIAFMRIAARVNDAYGPSSPTYKLTEEKWAAIDKEWRSNLDKANAEAEANGEIPVSQCLAETQTQPAKTPALFDPQKPSKFLNVDDKDIVGPMVQYVKLNPAPAPRKSSFLNVLKDPASMFGGRSLFGGSKRS